MLLAGLSASMSIPWCDSRSERLFDVTESVLGIGISGESPRNRTFHPWRSKCPYRRPTFQNPVNERISLLSPLRSGAIACRDGKLVNERLLTSETYVAQDRRCSFDLQQVLN